MPNNEEHTAMAREALLKSIVMLKNTDNSVIKPAGDEKLTVYIPYKYSPATTSRRGTTPASFAPSMDIAVASQYFNVITDTVGTPSGEGNTYLPGDVIRASAEDIAKADLVIVRVASPKSNAPTTGYDENMKVPADYEYIPRSLQYRPYTADNMYVRFESIGGQITLEAFEGVYGTEYDYVKENRSYFGKTGTVSNEADLDFVLEIDELTGDVPLVLVMNLNSSMVWSEIEPSADAILVSFGAAAPTPPATRSSLKSSPAAMSPPPCCPCSSPSIWKPWKPSTRTCPGIWTAMWTPTATPTISPSASTGAV